MTDELDDSDYGYVCNDCIEDEVLSGDIALNGTLATCSYCNVKSDFCVTIEWLGSRIDGRYRELVEFVELSPDIDADSDSVNWVQDGETPGALIAAMMQAAHDEIADDIVSYLSEKYSFDVHKDGETDWYDNENDVYRLYTRASAKYHLAWEGFCLSIKHQRRFFSSDAVKVLDEILGPILIEQNAVFQSAIRTIGPESSDRFIYRGRLANDEASRKQIYARPINELGAPPVRFATAGRMNPHGISVFYGSTDVKTCVAELRAPVHGTAIVGKFEIIKPLRIFDLTELWKIRNSLSYFHEDYFNAHDYALFIRGFHSQIRKPVIPGRELLEYLPTQVVAEYLWTRAKGAVDGLIFSSSQLSGEHQKGERKNIVLFPGACIIEGAKEEPKLEISDVMQHGGPTPDNEDYDEDYSETVWYKKALQTPKKLPKDAYTVDLFDHEEALAEPKPSLRFHHSAMTVATVNTIEYSIAEKPVGYHAELGDEMPF